MKIIILIIYILLIGCESIPQKSEIVLPTTTTTQKPNFNVSLSWKKPSWDKFIIDSIDQYWIQLSKATDMKTVCQKYDLLNEEKKKLVFAELVVAMSFYESGWKPTAWMTENLGIDKITGKQVKSEGLLQLSYGDIQWAKHCQFDWKKDKVLKQEDSNKTIFDPYKNLNCGIGILARQVDKKQKVFLSTGAYWAVIKTGGKYEKISKIKTKVISAVKECI